jgi:hypothetical protein
MRREHPAGIRVEAAGGAEAGRGTDTRRSDACKAQGRRAREPLRAAQATARAGVRADQTGARLPPVPAARLRSAWRRFRDGSRPSPRRVGGRPVWASLCGKHRSHGALGKVIITVRNAQHSVRGVRFRTRVAISLGGNLTPLPAHQRAAAGCQPDDVGAAISLLQHLRSVSSAIDLARHRPWQRQPVRRLPTCGKLGGAMVG